MDFYKAISIVLSLLLLFVFTNEFVYSQKIVNWQSYHVQNNANIIDPFLHNEKKVYDIEPKNYTIIKNFSNISPINNTISYIITNATITVNEKISKGMNWTLVSQTFIKPSETIVFAKR